MKTNSKPWGGKLKEFRRNAGLTQDDLLDELSHLESQLEEENTERAARILELIKGATNHYLDKTVISRIESRGLSIPLERSFHLALIHILNNHLVIDSDKANAWLKIVGLRDLEDPEFCVLDSTKILSENLKYLDSSEQGQFHTYIPQSSESRQYSEPFLSFHEVLINSLCDKLSSEDASNRFFVLYGPDGMGKAKIARAVFTRLREVGVFASFHSVNHIVDEQDGFDARDTFVERISGDFKISNTLTIDEQKGLIQSALENHLGKWVLVLTGIRYEIENQFIEFLEKLPNSVKVLITHSNKVSGKDDTSNPYEHIQLTEIKEGEVDKFFKACELEKSLMPETIKRIHVRTKGNSFALRRVVELWKNKPSLSLDEILQDNTILLHEWFGSLSPYEQEVITALSIFKASVDWRILAQICGLNAYEYDDHPTFLNCLNSLHERGILSRDQKKTRYTLNYPYLKTVWRIGVRDSGKGKELKRRWVNAYLQLRPIKPYVEWAIFTDYSPDKPNWISFTAEIDTIIDVVQYCASSNRSADEPPYECAKDDSIEKCWIIAAARLVNNFRFTLYATGKWAARTKLCTAVLSELERIEPQSHFVPELKRQIAWIECFQDNYHANDKAEIALEHARIGMQSMDDSKLPQSHLSFTATYYKSLDTLGRIALRKAQNAVNWAQFFRQVKRRYPDLDQTKLNTIVESWFREADDLFDDAKYYFAMALGVANAVFPLEVPFAQYLLAEASYYDRHRHRLPDDDNLVKKNLADSQDAFNRVLEEWKEHYSKGSTHNRLVMHVNYYLGKIHRRLLKKDAKEILKDTQKLAEEFADAVLSARIKFALGHLYEEQARKAKGLDTNAVDDLTQTYRKLVKDAAIDLANLGMVVESTDAVAFLLRPIRTGATTSTVRVFDIPLDLLESFKVRCEDAITHFEKQIPDHIEFSKLVIDRVLDRNSPKD